MTGGREQHCSRGTTFLPLQLRSAWTLARPPPLPPPLARCSPDPLCNKAPLVRTHTARPSLPPAPLTGARAPTPLRRRRQKKRKTAEDEREGDEAPLTLTRHVHKEDTFTRTRPVQSGETNEDGQERRRKKKARVSLFLVSRRSGHLHPLWRPTAPTPLQRGGASRARESERGHRTTTAPPLVALTLQRPRPQRKGQRRARRAGSGRR